MTLFELTETQRAIEDALYESGGELTPEIEEALAVTKESLPAKIDGYNTVLRKLGYMADNCKAEIERLTKLKRTAENAQKSLKKHVLDAMNVFGYDMLEGRTCKMSKGSTKSLEVDEEILLADVSKKIAELSRDLPDYVTVEVKVSKKIITDAYKQSGVLPAGVSEKKSEYLTVR